MKHFRFLITFDIIMGLITEIPDKRCDNVLRKRPGFYSSNLDNYIDNVRKGDLRYLPWIFCTFAEDSPKHKVMAALMRLNPEKYIPDITEMLAKEHYGIVKTATQLLKKLRLRF